jgi:hypothetical protein
MKKSLALLIASVLATAAASAQDFGRPPLPSTGIPVLDEARRAQRAFEAFRREHLLPYEGRQGGSGGNKDVEEVGKFIYWYDDKEPPPPPEPEIIKAQRAMLISILDSAASKYPQDDWTAGQRVRYTAEDGRGPAVLAAARACRGSDWWCSALIGFAFHDARDFVRAESAYNASLSQMPARLRCDWSDASVLLDPYTLPAYHRTACGTPERERFEKRMWWLSKPLYSIPGLDTHTEYLARMTMVRMLEEAPSAHQFGFDIDERELLLRYGWPRAWSLGESLGGQPLLGGGRSSLGGGDFPDQTRSIIGHEPTPSYQFIMPAVIANAPAMSDSVDWETGAPPVHARYAPMYARRMAGLVHQSALFRRGDSSLLVVAWDASDAPIRKDIDLTMSLVQARSDSLKPFITTQEHAQLKGYIIGHGPWGQQIMSAELTGAGMDTAVRARYGLRPPLSIGARVTLSEMLFFGEYDGLPQNLEQAAEHALPSIKLRNDQKLGIFFENYGTNPAGEKLKITFTVAREDDEPGFVRRRLAPLGISQEANPVRLTVEDMSAIGQRMTPRAAYVDISTLKKGAYIVQLEVEVAGQYVVRTERALEVLN